MYPYILQLQILITLIIPVIPKIIIILSLETGLSINMDSLNISSTEVIDDHKVSLIFVLFKKDLKPEIEAKFD